MFAPGIFVILRKTLPVRKRSMLVARFRFACLTLAVCLAATPAAAQLIPGWDTKQFTFERIDAERIRLMREVEVNGVGPNQGQQIFADELEWNTTTGEFTARGNVLLSSPTARLSSESVVFNTKTGTGTFYTASGLASLGDRATQEKSMFGTLEPDIYFWGERIEKIGPDKYRLHKGGFTTCVQPTPRWDVVSGSATINLGDYAILRNAIVRVKDVPVFYVPALYYPIQDDDRATGFLLPTYGRSLYAGQSLSNAFFWAISRSQDLTLLHDWYTKTGQGAGSEYRYIASPGSEGNFRLYWLSQKQATFETNGVTTTSAGGRSYEINGGVAQVLPFGIRARGRVDYFSSLTTQQLYNTNIYEASRRQRTYGGSVTGSWAGVSVTGNFQRSELFTSDTDSIVNGYAPSITTNLSSKRIGRLPIYAAVNSELSNIIYQDKRRLVQTDLGLERFDATPTLRAALSKWPFLNVNASVGYRVTYFSESLNERQLQVPVPLTRQYFDLRTDLVGPVFSKVYTPNNAIADRLKHVIEPNFNIQHITDFENLSRVVTHHELLRLRDSRRHANELRADQPDTGAQDAVRSEGQKRRERGARGREHLDHAVLLHRSAGEPVRQQLPVVQLHLDTPCQQLLAHCAHRTDSADRAHNRHAAPRIRLPDRNGEQFQRHRQQQLPRRASRRRLEHAHLFVHVQGERAERVEHAGVQERHDGRHVSDELGHRARLHHPAALDRLLQRAVLRPDDRIPAVQLPLRSAVPDSRGSPVQHVVLAGRHRHVLEFLRGLRRREWTEILKGSGIRDQGSGIGKTGFVVICVIADRWPPDP